MYSPTLPFLLPPRILLALSLASFGKLPVRRKLDVLTYASIFASS